MKKLIHLAAFCLALLSCIYTSAQDFSNKGKDFWIAYTGHIDGTASVMGLYLTSDVNATGTVKVGSSVLPFSVTANQVTTLFIGGSSGAVTNTFVYNGQSDAIGADRGIHVVSDKNIVVYAHIIRSARSGATLVLPTPVLGKDYIVPSYRNLGASAGYGQITVVAVEDNTTIEIRPTVGDRNGAHPANVPFTVVLPNKGDVYQIQSSLNQDYSGTKVRSIAVAGGGCKPIAVFSSTTWSGFDCTNASGGDNLYQQLFPTKSWGKKFVTAPFINKPYDIIRVFVQNSGTTVTKTEAGITAPLTALINGSYYEVKTSQPLVIEADEPVSVVQYITSQTCGGGNSDPEMTLINPVEQTLDAITLFSAHQAYVPPGQTQVTQHYINVVIPTSHKATFRIDGNFPTAAWVDVPSSGYSYLQEDVTVSSASNPVHKLVADTGFTAIVYGYGNVESYGYNAGTNVRDLYQFVSIYNEYATVNFPATCVGAPFYFSMVFPYQPTEIEWQFGGLFPDVTLINPAYDSTWFVNGRQVYRYKLPTPYNISTVGTYPITVVAQNPTADGCGNEQEINYDLEVFAKPVANFNFTTNGCVSDPVSFFDLTNPAGREIIKWSWSFGDGGTSNLQNPTHIYPTAGSYIAKFSIITDVGCVSDTIPKTVNLNQSPIAKFGATGPFCIGNTVTFTDSSTTATSSPLVKWIWNFGDGSPVVNATTNAPQPHTYAAPGTYNVTLQVETATGCKSGVYTLPVIINTKPTASFTNGGTCLPDGATQFTDASFGGTGFTYLWNFGDGGTSTLQNPIHNYTTAGPFNVTLTITSGSGCIDDTTIVVNTVFAQPVAGFNVNKTESCPGETLNFTSTTTAAGSTITQWFWDFADGTTANIQNPTKTYTLPGTYIVKHWAKSAAGCTSDTARTLITVLPPPLASFTASPLRCEKQAIQFTSTSVPNGGVINSTQWFVNGTLSASTPVFNFTPANAGVYSIRLAVTTDRGCSDDSTMSITVNPSPVPDFSLPNVCLPAGAAAFTNLTTIGDGTISTVSYQWSFGDGGTSTATSPTHNYTAPGPFNVNLIATSAAGCVKDTTKQLTTVFAQPQAVPTAPAEVCLGGSIAFSGSGSTAPGSTVAQWNWSFDDGTTATGVNPSKTFTTTGPHTATLTVTSAAGCVSAPVTISVTVNPLPTPRFRITSPSCANKAITFEDISIANAGTIVRRTWNMGDGTPATDRPAGPFNYTYAAVGTYTVTLQVQTDKGCTSTVFDSTITVNPLPAPAFTMPESCVNDPFSQFTDGSTIADGSEAGFTFAWNFGDPAATPGNPNTSNLRNPQHKYTSTGTFPVTLVVTSDKGCSNTLTQDFTVNGGLPLSAFTINGGTEFCSNTPVSITNASSVDRGNVVKLEIFWDATGDLSNKTVDEDPVTGRSYNVTYPAFFTPASKTYTIRVRAYSGQTCFDDEIKTITINARPDIQFPAITGVCEDVNSKSITASATNIPGTGVFSGPGVSPTGVFTPSVAGAGIHTIRYTFTGANGCADFKEQTIEVSPIPTIRVTASRTVLEDGSITMDATVVADNPTYVWTPATWLSSTSIARPIASPKEDITYTLNVTSEDGCKASATVFVRVLKVPTIPNVFTPNGDNINDKWEIPFLDTYVGATIEIYNRYGQLVYQSKGYSKPWDGTVNGKPVPMGTYYYLINPKNGRKQMSGFVDIIR